ncbi:hypothetical protein J3R82DRAFT_10042 [Butyriboletus roseoflavus]|nr:hypothetical protein J3R82DRAFT_10042 [Butyriboletus roseoflavus]
MARIKQTTGLSTGGAIRVRLGSLKPSGRRAQRLVKRTTGSTSEEQTTILSRLPAFDVCRMSTRTRRPQECHQRRGSGLPMCRLSLAPPSAQRKLRTLPESNAGLYKGKNTGPPNHFASPRGFEILTRGIILSPRVLFLHPNLYSISSHFHADIIHSGIRDYYPHGGLDVHHVPFDLGTDRATQSYTQRAHELAAISSNYDHVLIVLTT